jgi:hypothetical protein
VRRTAKSILIAAGLVAAVLLGSYALSRSKDETPEKAIYGLAHDVEHADVRGVCDRLFPSGVLPDAIARALGLPSEPSRDRWETQHLRCLREFGSGGAFGTSGFVEPRVRSVSRVGVKPEGGVTAAATALVAFDRKPPATVKLVEFRGKWRVVVHAR